MWLWLGGRPNLQCWRKKNEIKEKEAWWMCLVFMDSHISLFPLKCRLVFRNMLQGAGGLDAGQNTTYSYDKGCCLTRSLLQFLLNQEVIKEHMPPPLHSIPPPPSKPFLSGPDGGTAHKQHRCISRPRLCVFVWKSDSKSTESLCMSDPVLSVGLSVLMWSF